MHSFIRIIFFIPVCTWVFISSCTVRHESSAPGFKVSDAILNAPPHFFDKPEEYLDWQAGNLLNMVHEITLKNEPQYPEIQERHMALLMLDAVFHDVDAPKRPSVWEFHHKRTQLALEEMKTSTVKEGALIWRLYNMATVVRTSSVTVGFDLTRGLSSGSENFALSENTMKEIVDQCDILFISHRHRDHADEWVAQVFIDQNKPVVAPPNVWEGLPIHSQITHMEREPHIVQTLLLNTSEALLRFVLYPGHQGDLLNNVTLVITPEDISFCQTGDQSNDKDFEWIDEVKNHFRTDILLPNCWTTHPLRMAQGFNPSLIITAHENELGHTIDHREAYALSYARWNVPFPWLIMTWGESYHYIPEK